MVRCVSAMATSPVTSRTCSARFEPRPSGSRLASDKGINLPGSNLNLPALPGKTWRILTPSHAMLI